MTDDLLRELGKELPWDRPDDARRDTVRASVLLAAAETGARAPARRYLAIGAAFAAGALVAAIAAVVLLPRDRVEPASTASAAQITASSTARLEHTTIATPTGVDEIVRVRSGTVRLDAGRVPPGAHVRVRTDGAEVSGTDDFEVIVVADALTAVTVHAGTASIAVANQRTIILAAGQTWRSSVITADLGVPAPEPRTPDTRTPDVRTPDTRTSDLRTPDVRASDTGKSDVRASGKSDVRGSGKSDTRASDTRTSDTRASDTRTSDARVPGPIPSTLGDKRETVGPSEGPGSAPAISTSTSTTPSSTSRGAPGTTSAPRAATAIEVHFQAGWRLLREGKAREAAVELGMAADAGTDEPLAADARYFQAVALVRAGQGREAERVLVAFLDRAPRSLRRGRASIMLAQLIAKRGDLASARAWYRSAIDDPDPAIAAAAQAGLASLEPHER